MTNVVNVLNANVHLLKTARETPGTVPVIITTETGDYLGETQYTYVDQSKEAMKEMLSNKRKLAEFFYDVAKLFKSDDCIENKTQGSQDVGELGLSQLIQLKNSVLCF